MTSSRRQLRALLLTLAAVAACPGLVWSQEIGPPGGSLVIVGGAMRDPAIVQRFIGLAGGPEAPIVIVPTAGGGEEYDRFNSGLGAFRAQGATDLTVLHTWDRDEADSEAFVAPLRRARGVWFGGGRQWRLADVYMGTLTERELWTLLERGGVIGGSSAGATILGSYLVRGDTRTNTVMMGDHEVGFGFLRASAIDQHLLRRNRHFDLIEVIRAHPDLLGIGIDENTAVVVTGDRFDVMGQGYVAIYDHGAMTDSGGPFYFLAPGDRFDLATRTPYRAAQDYQEIGGLQRAPWPGGG
ncbi:MAG TPA: cyanophycinase [Longimicrobiales bacterium]|jgi:cyanophycinase